MIASGVILALGALSSCSNDKTYDPSTGSIQILHFYIAGVETGTTTGDINSSKLHKDNTVGSDGSLTSSSSKVAKERSSLKVFAYAPHNDSWRDHTTAQTFTVDPNQSELAGYLASDLLYAEGTTITKLPADQSAIPLTFTHKMARFILNIET